MTLGFPMTLVEEWPHKLSDPTVAAWLIMRRRPRAYEGRRLCAYTASLMDWKLKSRVLTGGITMAAPMSPDSDALTQDWP